MLSNRNADPWGLVLNTINISRALVDAGLAVLGEFLSDSGLDAGLVPFGYDAGLAYGS